MCRQLLRSWAAEERDSGHSAMQSGEVCSSLKSRALSSREKGRDGDVEDVR